VTLYREGSCIHERATCRTEDADRIHNIVSSIEQSVDEGPVQGWINHLVGPTHPSGSHSGAPFEAPFVDFCVTKFTQNFLRRHLKENDMLKILAACHLGAPFQPGALRACVPCLMVNPAVRLQWMGPWCKPIYFNVSWLVDNLYVGFAEIFPVEKILYAKNVTTITIRKCQQRVTSSTYVTGLPTFFSH